jgi:hypothetical protein
MTASLQDHFIAGSLVDRGWMLDAEIELYSSVILIVVAGNKLMCLG